MTETMAYLIGLPLLAILCVAALCGTAFIIGVLCRNARNQWSYE